MTGLVNGCYRCKIDYKVTEFLPDGMPAHVHYCNDCVKQCAKCHTWLVIIHFLPILEHTTYQDWIGSKSSEHDNPLGILMGRDCVDDLCMECKPFRQPVAPPRVHPSPAIAPPDPKPDAIIVPIAIVVEEEDELAHLEALLARRKKSKGY